MKLLTRGASSPKLTKGSEGIESVILHLAPGRTCPWASKGCLAACLNTAGRGAMSTVQAARQRRTDLFFEDRGEFMWQLDREIGNAQARARSKGFTPVVRLNGTSDIPWEAIRYGVDERTVFERFPGVTFYDYTKSEERALRATSAEWPHNYSLTLSRTEAWDPWRVRSFTLRGVNVAVVFDTPKGADLPRAYGFSKVIDGRANDWRFKDPRGVVVGLSALGKARKDTTGFVVKVK